MRPVVQKLTLSRLLILAWLMTWVTTVPLFHIHLPDTTDGPASLQGGLAHTVFSPDLPGEFSRSFNVTHQEHFAGVSNRVSNSPEFGIALLDDDSKKRKVGQASVLGVLCCLPNRPLLPNFGYRIACDTPQASSVRGSSRPSCSPFRCLLVNFSANSSTAA